MADVLPYCLLALSLIGAPLLLMLAFRALRRADERAQRPNFPSQPGRNGTHHDGRTE